MIILQGDVLKTPFEIIAHQTNCMGVMGGGVAKQIREQYPFVYEEYKSAVTQYGSMYMLGKGQIVFCEGHTFFNIFGQYNYGRDRKYTDYDAFKSAFIDAIDKYRDEDEHQITIAIPYNIGCGLAGGDWNVVSKILEDLEKEKNVVFVAYEYK